VRVEDEDEDEDVRPERSRRGAPFEASIPNTGF
jgi:hypothetical protein